MPPFTFKDVVVDAEAVRKFMRCCIQEEKDLMKLELQMYDNKTVDLLYDEYGTALASLDDGREPDSENYQVDLLLLNPRRLDEPHTSDITNPVRSWDGKSVDVHVFPPDQVGLQTDPRPEKVKNL